MKEIINKIILLTMFISCGISAEFENFESGIDFTKVNFDLGEVQYDSNSKILYPLDANIKSPEDSNVLSTSLFYQYNGEIELQIDSFNYEIINGNFTVIPQPEILVSSSGKMRGYNFYKLTISPLIQHDDNVLIFNSINFTVYENEINNISGIEPRLSSKVFENLMFFLIMKYK